MEFKHRFIDGSQYRRIYVTGDIHGKLALLQHTLASVEFDAEFDLLISVGDLIDRGPDSVGVIHYYHQHAWFEAVMGNHEWMMVNAIDAESKADPSDKEAYFMQIWQRNGNEWAQSLGREEKIALRNVIAELPSVITVALEDGRRFGIAHAQPHSLDWNEMMLWQGDMWDNPRWIWGRTRIAEASPSLIANVDFTLHGHTRSEAMKTVANSLFLDTASSDDYQGAFTFYELRSGQTFVGLKQSELKEVCIGDC